MLAYAVESEHLNRKIRHCVVVSGANSCPLYKLYRHVRRQRVWWLSRFGLCKKSCGNTLPEFTNPVCLANEFGEFFTKKIDLILENIDAINVEPPLLDCHCGDVKLSQFSELSENKVRQLLKVLRTLHVYWILYQHGYSNFALMLWLLKSLIL